MKRNVQKGANFFNKLLAELYFVFNVSILKPKRIFRYRVMFYLEVFAKKHKPLEKHILAMFYKRCLQLAFFCSDFQYRCFQFHSGLRGGTEILFCRCVDAQAVEPANVYGIQRWYFRNL
jgi:hypothetical protein